MNAAATQTNRPRFTTLAIPGDSDRGAPDLWYVFDRHARQTVQKCDDRAHACEIAAEMNDPIQG